MVEPIEIKLLSPEDRFLIKPSKTGINNPNVDWHISHLVRPMDIKPVTAVLDLLNYYHYTPHIGGPSITAQFYGGEMHATDINILALAENKDEGSSQNHVDAIKYFYHPNLPINPITIYQVGFLSQFTGRKIEYSRAKIDIDRKSVV